MALTAGERLGTYEIGALIGSGGMGEVYRARDTKLGREVAIKVLPEEFSRDPERLTRFEREAKLLASLNHANIATLYGLEEADGRLFLSMELVEGETLAERIALGPIPIDEALPMLMQIAEALEAAHERGVIHRDLKPANIKITPEGKIKILDFGLAKAFLEEREGGGDVSQSPTLTKGTAIGVIMGTAAYMSPEQAKGKPVDRRADLWAFGAVLFEMLTGRRAFPGDDVSESLAAVIRAEPEWNLLPTATPTSVRRLMKRCLEKDRRERLADAADARIEIRDAQRAPDDVPAEPVARAGRAIWQRPLGIAGIGLVALLLGILGASSFVSSPVATSPTVKRFEVLLQFQGPAVSPDGETLVFASSESGVTRLYQLALDQLKAEAIPGTEGASSPFFSPDGRWVGFMEGDRLKKVAVDGGAPQLLASVLGLSGATWGFDGMIIVGREAQGLATVPESGGAVESLTALGDEELSHRWPHFVPSARAVVFETQAKSGPERVLAYFVDTGQQRFLAEGFDPRVVSSGYLLIGRSQTIWAVAIDLESLATRGEPAPVVDGVEGGLNRGLEYVVAPDGTLLFNPRGAGEARIVRLESDGASRVIAGREEGLYYHPPLSLSPDGRHLAVTTHPPGAEDQIAVFDLERGTSSRLVPDGNSRFPVWSPDGRRLAFASTRAGSWDLYRVSLDDAATVEPLLVQPGDQFPSSWSPDGQSLVYISNPEVERELWVLPVGDEPTRRPGSSIEAPSISPDGRWLAYARRPNVFIEPFPEPGRPEIVSPEGGSQPVWSPDGRRLYYAHDGALFTVAIGSGPALEIGEPERVATVNLAGDPTGFPAYVVAADESIIMLDRWQEGPRPVVVINWFAELERLVPTDD